MSGIEGGARRLIQPLFPGPLDIVGDVHGEIDALRDLLRVLGYGRDGVHPAGRRLAFTGDLTDFGPDSPAVLEFVSGLVKDGLAQCVLGDHELKLQRGISSAGNGWVHEVNHDHAKGLFLGSQNLAASQRHAMHAALDLPLALERADLRLVHAAWHANSIETIRRATDTAPDLDQYLFKRAAITNMESGLDRDWEIEELVWQEELLDPRASVPLLHKIAESDIYLRAQNPVRIVTSGLKRVADAPYFARGKWRMTEPAPWWDDYRDDVPVIIGHYWRWPTVAARQAYSGGDPDLLMAYKPNQWFGAKRNVFCVDFAVGARYRERAVGATDQFQCRLAAVRWPERLLAMDDGSQIPLSE